MQKTMNNTDRTTLYKFYKENNNIHSGRVPLDELTFEYKEFICLCVGVHGLSFADVYNLIKESHIHGYFSYE